MFNFLLMNFFLLNPYFKLPSSSIDKSSFNEAIYHILKEEGGLSENEYDKGGITKYGISLNYIKNLVKKNPTLINYFDLDDNDKIDSYDIIHLTKFHAEDIYKKFWWNKYGYGKIDYQPLVNKIFDLSINVGPFPASLLLSKACKKLDKNFSIPASSELNENIITYINNLNINQKQELLNNVRYYASQHYIQIVEVNPSQKKFLKGWLKRANK